MFFFLSPRKQINVRSAKFLRMDEEEDCKDFYRYTITDFELLWNNKLHYIFVSAFFMYRMSLLKYLIQNR